MITIEIKIQPWGESWEAAWDAEGPDFRAFGTQEGRTPEEAFKAASKRARKAIREHV